MTNRQLVSNGNPMEEAAGSGRGLLRVKICLSGGCGRTAEVLSTADELGAMRQRSNRATKRSCPTSSRNDISAQIVTSSGFP
jgi:hypothetical protein